MNQPIRVLHVLGKLNRGGAESMVMNLYRTIDRDKIQFDFIVHTNEPGEFDDEILQLGGAIYRVPTYNGKNHFKYLRAWDSFFSQYTEYKIIHGHVRSTAAIYFKIAKKYQLVTISHSHNTSNGTSFRAIAKKILQYPIRYIADFYMAPTIEAGEWLFGNKIVKQNNFFILKNSINTDNFVYNSKTRKKIRNELGIDNKTIVGHIGRFEEQKNHDFLIEIFERYQKINPESLLLLVGVGPLENKIKSKIDEYDLLNKVLYLGVRSDIEELMQAMDIFIFPSLYEGLGIVAIEAQAADLPVIASNTIPKEVGITENIKFKSLESSASEWAEEISVLLTKSRKDIKNKIISAGYDIHETTDWLSSFYLAL